MILSIIYTYLHIYMYINMYVRAIEHHFEDFL